LDVTNPGTPNQFSSRPFTRPGSSHLFWCREGF
jgi:hypothetical protein